MTAVTLTRAVTLHVQDESGSWVAWLHLGPGVYRVVADDAPTAAPAAYTEPCHPRVREGQERLARLLQGAAPPSEEGT